VLVLVLALAVGTAWGEPTTPDDDTDAAEPEAELYVYVDDEGSLHVVSSPALAPARYRSRARPASLEAARSVQGMGKRESARRPETRSRRDEPARASPAASVHHPDKPKIETARKTKGSSLDELRDERIRVLDELGSLAEGWLDSDESNPGEEDPTADELIHRSEELTRRIEELDEAIGALE